LNGPAEPIEVGRASSATATIKNNGPDTASETATTLDMDNGHTTELPDQEDAECDNPPGSEFNCFFLGDLSPGQAIDLHFDYEAENSGVVNFGTSVSTEADDPNEENNNDKLEIDVWEDLPYPVKTIEGCVREDESESGESFSYLDWIAPFEHHKTGTFEVELTLPDGSTFTFKEEISEYESSSLSASAGTSSKEADDPEGLARVTVGIAKENPEGIWTWTAQAFDGSGELITPPSDGFNGDFNITREEIDNCEEAMGKRSQHDQIRNSVEVTDLIQL
jgi:hypothetical protein